MQVTAVRGVRPHSLRRAAAGIFLTFGLAIPTSATAGEQGAWPESIQTHPGPVLRGVMQVRHVLQSPPPAPPAAPAENEPAPMRPVAPRQPPALLQLPGDPPETDPPAAAVEYEIEPLRQAEIRVAPLATYVTNRTESELTVPDNLGASVFAKQVHLGGAENGWFESVPTGHVACVDYHPLYFEELSLERYGDSFGCWQPLVSAAHFYGTLPLLPYKLVSTPPCGYESSCQYPPAATPAGRISCWRPIDLKGAAFEAGVIAAAILLVP